MIYVDIKEVSHLPEQLAGAASGLRDAFPGMLFVSFVIPAVIRGGVQPAVGTVATLLVMIYTRNLALGIAAGVAASWAVWAL